MGSISHCKDERRRQSSDLMVESVESVAEAVLRADGSIRFLGYIASRWNSCARAQSDELPQWHARSAEVGKGYNDHHGLPPCGRRKDPEGGENQKTSEFHTHSKGVTQQAVAVYSFEQSTAHPNRLIRRDSIQPRKEMPRSACRKAVARG